MADAVSLSECLDVKKECDISRALFACTYGLRHFSRRMGMDVTAITRTTFFLLSGCQAGGKSRDIPDKPLNSPPNFHNQTLQETFPKKQMRVKNFLAQELVPVWDKFLR
jgi:hypothetical protein